MAQAIAALHYLSIFLLFALLGIEHLQFKQPLDLARARRLVIIDIAYGVSASLVLFSGAAWLSMVLGIGLLAILWLVSLRAAGLADDTRLGKGLQPYPLEL